MYIYTHTHFKHIYIYIHTHVVSTVQVSHLKNKTKTNKQGFRWETSRSPQLCAAAAGSFPGLPQGEPRGGPVWEHGCSTRFGHKRGVPTHARLPGRSCGTLRSALHAPKVSSLGSRHRHLVRALSLTLLAAPLGKPP